MSQVKPEVAFSLLKYFRWFVQSHKTTLVSFYIAQKQRVKDSGWFGISDNDSSCKQISDEETFAWLPGTDYLFFRVCHLGITLLGRPWSRQCLNCLPMWSLTHSSAMELITSHWHKVFSSFPELLAQMSSQPAFTMCGFWVQRGWSQTNKTAFSKL